MPKRLFLLVLWGAVFGATLSAEAYESFPEFRSLLAHEPIGFDDPKMIDSETSSDFITYLKPLEMDARFYSSPLAYDLSVGSVSSKEFLIDQRVKFHQVLSKNLEFRFTWFEDRDLDEDFSTQVVEMIYWGKDNFGLAAYGSMSLHKAENDVGFAILNRRAGESRLYLTYPDFQRNIRTRESDRFAKPPWVLGYVFRRPLSATEQGKAFKEFSYRLEGPTRWERPLAGQEYEYQRQTWQYSLLNDHWGLRFFHDRKHESQSPLGSSLLLPEVWTSEKAFVQIERRLSGLRLPLRFGLNYLYRDYKKDNDRIVFKDVLPTIWLEASERWHVGYDLTLHWAQDPGYILNEPIKSYASEHRLNLVYKKSFLEPANSSEDSKPKLKSEIQFLFTIDLDRFGTDETWEGGAGRFSLTW